MTFEPRHAIVTASDSGIGKATAPALAKNGMDVGITWHSDFDGAESTAEEGRSHGRKAVVKELDYTDLPACGVTVEARSLLPGMLQMGSQAGSHLSSNDWRKA
jgi:NAD(P)-dependent dehydrogenase (short-subunit alcohol dehydrogenase family)